jgi:hypothetical protein
VTNINTVIRENAVLEKKAPSKTQEETIEHILSNFLRLNFPK